MKSPLRLVPFASTSRASNRDTNVILLPASLLKSNEITAGQALVLIPALTNEELARRLSLEKNAGKIQERRFALGVAWPSASLEANTISAHPNLLEGVAGSGDLVLVSPLAKSGLSVQTATEIAVSIVQENATGKSPEADEYLLEYIKQSLYDLERIQPEQTVQLNYANRQLKIGLHVKAAKKAQVYRVDSSTSIIHAESKIRATATKVNGVENADLLQSRPRATYDAVGGLDAQIQQIKELVELPLTRPELYAHFGLPLPRGLLLYGPPGTGKTLLASAVASSLDVSLFVIDGPSLSSPFHGETEERLRDIFAEATQSPKGSIIVIDEIDALAPKREDAGEVDKRVVATLLTLMDGVDSKKVDEGHVMVIAATNRPNAIDPALRRPGRFDQEIEIGVPNAEGRLSILQVLLRNTPLDIEVAAIKDIADRAHGFVGADLASLVRSAALNAIRRADQKNLQGMRLELADLESALLITRPSAMREVLVEAPQTSWADIGGLESVKQALKQAVDWPLRHPEAFKRLGVRPWRGILLYGPPGCSKTLVAQAMATEAQLNFITIKGPEVFNKFVGESERTIRDTFRKARLAAPSILFIDEIDAIASTRDSDESSPTSSRVLTTLLTEMDGVESLNGVVILAATNRPFAIDSALLRPGRLDHLLYLGPPDEAARQAIFDIQTARMSIEPGLSTGSLAQQTDGRSGAEVVSICQSAAMRAMQEDIDAPCVKIEHFEQAIKSVRGRISPEMLGEYADWRDAVGIM